MDHEYIKKNYSDTGKCGNAMNWYYLDGSLYIEGTGEMERGAFAGDMALQTVVIAPGCTSIGEDAFWNCGSLEEISLPAGLRRIENFAFYGCANLQDLVLPDGLEIIGECAFWKCSSLSLTVPEDVREIGPHAFQDIRELHYMGLIELDDNWGNKCRETVKLHCKICGHCNDSILTVNHSGAYEGAEIAAYIGAVNWSGQHPVPDAQFEITVESPFCCPVGYTFWAMYGDNLLVQAKLISILAMEKYTARIKIQILAVKNRLSFLKPVMKEEAEKLLCSGEYDYCKPDGDLITPWIDQEDENTIRIYNTLGGGDINFHDYIYTDSNGIDHWIMAELLDFEGNYAFVGDKILGAHIHRRYRWENDLFLDWKTKTVTDCIKDVKEITVPEGVLHLAWSAFCDCPDLERIIVPESVASVDCAQWKCPKLKEVVLCGNSALADKDFPVNVTITRT